MPNKYFLISRTCRLDVGRSVRDLPIKKVCYLRFTTSTSVAAAMLSITALMAMCEFV